MLGLIVLVAAERLALAACEDPVALTREGEVAVLQLELPVADEQLRRAEAAFACAPPPSPEAIARLWLARGVHATIEGRDGAARELLAAAARTAPDLWVEAYGAKMRAAWERAAAETRGRARGEVRLDPDPVMYRVWVDGQEATTPVSLEAGLHLVVVGPAGGSAQFGRIFMLPPGETLTITTGLVEPAAPAVEVAPPPELAALEARAEALRAAAARRWAEIEEPSREASARAERMLNGFVARYERASVSKGETVLYPVIPELEEARARLETLPARRAEEEARTATAEAAPDEPRRARPGGGRFGGVVLAVGGQYALEPTETPAATTPFLTFEGLGPSGRVGARAGLVGALGLGVEARYLGLYGSAPEMYPSPEGTNGGWTEPLDPYVHLGLLALTARLDGERWGVGAGPLYAVGLASTYDFGPGSLVNRHGVFGGVGGTVEGSAMLLRTRALKAGPSLGVSAFSDGERLYHWGEIGLTLVLGGAPR